MIAVILILFAAFLGWWWKSKQPFEASVRSFSASGTWFTVHVSEGWWGKQAHIWTGRQFEGMFYRVQAERLANSFTSRAVYEAWEAEQQRLFEKAVEGG